jgi:hypothetical protein
MKTRLEKQIQAYGEFQREIRNMSQNDKDKYAPPGTPEYARYQARVSAARARKEERERRLQEFDRDYKPRFTLMGVTAEDAANQLAAEQEWKAKRAQLIKRLDKELPLLAI